jgi:hypothetical protein
MPFKDWLALNPNPLVPQVFPRHVQLIKGYRAVLERSDQRRMGMPTLQSEDYGLSSREMSWLSIRERFFDFVINRRPSDGRSAKGNDRGSWERAFWPDPDLQRCLLPRRY